MFRINGLQRLTDATELQELVMRNVPKPILSELNDTVKKHFWSKVRVLGPDQCWNWMGAKRPDGYGVMRWGEGLGKMYKAHRVALTIWRGEELPSDLTVDHICNNRGCVNPAHLQTITQSENSKLSSIRNPRASPTRCPHGHEKVDGKCRTCNRTAQAEWKRKNPERAREIWRKYEVKRAATAVFIGGRRVPKRLMQRREVFLGHYWAA
jgi:hypothetical protein